MASAFEEQKDIVDTNVSRMRDLISTISTGDKDAARAANVEVARLQRDTERALKAMETEARGSAPSARRTLQDAISRSREEFARARAGVQKANDEASRSELMKGTAPGARSAKIEAETRDRAVNAAESAQRGTSKLQQAAQTISETQDIGINVIDTMQQQRETLIRATDKASDINSLTGVARSVMLGMQRRAITNKFILGGAVLVLMGLIGVVVYFGYIKN